MSKDNENVEHVQFTNHVNHKVLLRQLADDDRLEGITLVCKWKGMETPTVGWSSLPLGDVALGAMKLQDFILEEMHYADEPSE